MHLEALKQLGILNNMNEYSQSEFVVSQTGKQDKNFNIVDRVA